MADNRTQQTILVVEDNVPNRSLLVRRLQRVGWQVREAEDGPTALHICATQAISAVLLDMGLPDMDGLAVLRQLREHSTPLSLPVIMVTAFDAADYLVPALTAGANDFVNKPVDFSILQARLNTHLQLAAANQRLNDLQTRQALILRGANDGIWEWDIAEQRLTQSRRWLELLQLPEQQATDHIDSWLTYIHPDDQVPVREAIHTLMNDQSANILDIQYRIHRADGRYLWIHTRGAVDRDGQGQCQHIAGTHSNISEVRYKDRISGLPNIQYLLDTLVGIKHQTPPQHMGIMLFNFTHFENYRTYRNEYRQIIQKIANALKNSLHNFWDLGTGQQTQHLIVLIVSSELSLAALQERADQACNIINQVLAEESSPIKVQYTCGLQLNEVASISIEQAFVGALAASEYAAKQGKIVQTFDTDLAKKIQRQQDITALIPIAISRQGFRPWWQPILKNGQFLAGFEALARWEIPLFGMVSPAEFMPLIRLTGALPALTALILHQSLRMLAALQQQGLVGPSIYMAVNFDPEQIAEPSFSKMLNDAIQQHALQPHHLCIEIVESSWLEESELLQECLQKLRDQGYLLALDDFGTGYSSLSMLNRIPLSTLKIDQSFVRSMLTHKKVKALVEACIAIGQTLDLRIVAEGVENLEQEQYLLDAGVTFTQGYLRGRPMPATLLEAWLKEHS